MFKENVARTLPTMALVALVLCGTGCALVKPSEERAIELAEQRLQLDEVGDVVCTYWNSPPFYQPGNPTRQLGIADVENFDEIVTRLEEQDFVEDPNWDIFDSSLFYGPDGVYVTLYEFGPDTAGTEPPLDSDEPCLVPDEGLIGVKFEAFPLT